MAKLVMIIYLGGWSGGMWHDALESRIHINALGDIQVNHNFIDSVVEPFGRATTNERTKEAIASYAEHLEEITPRKSVAESFEEDFQEALRQEWGASVYDVRLFLDYLEALGTKQQRLCLTLPRSMLLSPIVGDASLPTETAQALLPAVTLPLRDNWRSVPPHYDEKDRQPWRFRRRLSVLRKPLIQLDDKPDPTIMVAPGLARDSLIYALGNYHRGDF